MRTTLTLDNDVAALLRQVREERGVTLKQAINDALRVGLTREREPAGARARYETRGVALGGCLLPNVDNIAEVLAIAEGDDYK